MSFRKATYPPRVALSLLGLVAIFSIASAEPSVTSGSTDVYGGRLYYETQGSGPAVVLIHGGQMDRRMWDSQFVTYSRRFRAIRYDVRWYGKSTSERVPYSDVDDLETLLTHLKVPKASLVGLSLGGRIAIDFSLAHPEQVQSLVLAAPGLSGFQFSGDTSDIVDAANEKGPAAAAHLWLKHPYMAPAMSNPAISGKIRQLVADNSRVWSAPLFLERAPGPPAINRLSEVHVPTLIIVGDRDVPDIQKIADLLAAGIPGAKKEIIHGSGHILNMEKPEQFDKVVLDFLTAHSH